MALFQSVVHLFILLTNYFIEQMFLMLVKYNLSDLVLVSSLRTVYLTLATEYSMLYSETVIQKTIYL